MSEPTNIVAGNTVAWTKTLADYPAPTWTLTYRFVKADASFQIVATDSGNDHVVNVLPAVTARWAPGSYAWVALVSDGTDRHTADQGTVIVEPDPAGADYDPRSFAEKTLEMIEAHLSDANNLAAANYSLGGRALSRWNRGDLLRERDSLKAEIADEKKSARLAEGLGTNSKIRVRFVS